MGAFTPPGWWKLFPNVSCALAVTVVLSAGNVVCAEVLFDSTLAITDGGTWFNEFPPTYIGGEAQFGDILRDQQGAEDLELVFAYRITSVTGDFLTLGDPPPADGVLVEFFPDVDGVPSEAPFAAVLASAVTVTTVLPDIFGDAAIRITVDLSGEDIVLNSGTWWVSITPVDLTPDVGLATFQFNSIADIFGSNAHFRNGGVDHGNGYPGLYGTDDWTMMGDMGGGSPNRDLAMKIEGNRVTDLDGDGVVGISDLLMLLSDWGPCPPKGDCLADFDNTGDVGISDLLMLLSQWG